MVLYELFCDLLHPKIGSTLLIMKKWTESVGFGGQDGEPVGEDVFIWTLAGLVALFRDIQIISKQCFCSKYTTRNRQLTRYTADYLIQASARIEGLFAVGDLCR